MNITLSVDERVADRARQVAKAHGKSLNQLVRDYLAKIAGDETLQDQFDELGQLTAQGRGTSEGRKIVRDELYERTL